MTATAQSRVAVAAVGDVQLGDSSVCTGFGIATRHSRTGVAEVFDGVADELKADITIGNLETVLSRAGLEPGRWSSVQMRGFPSYADDLRDAGFTLLNVANNHTYQHGRRAFDETVAILEGVGVRVCGIRGRGPWSSRPTIIELPARGATVGCLGYSLRPRQFRREAPPFAEGRPEAMIDDVTRLATSVDHVLVCVHWGEEFVHEPARSEVTLGRSLLDAGARGVLGHHPHVVRAIEAHQAGLVAYSLGNFTTDMLWKWSLRKGVVLRFTLAPEGVAGVTVTRTYVDDRCRVQKNGRPASGDSDLVVNRVEGLEEAEYRMAARRSLRSHRAAKYGYALAHLHRYPKHLLWQLAHRTMVNKWRTLVPSRTAVSRGKRRLTDR